MTDQRASAYSYSDINDIQSMGSSAVSDVHFGHFSYSLHLGIGSGREMDPSQTNCTGSYTQSRKNPRKLNGTPKIHKNNTLLRPIVSSCGSITYNAAKYLASILSPPLWVRTVTASKTSRN